MKNLDAKNETNDIEEASLIEKWKSLITIKMKSVKQDNNYPTRTELDIKMEPQEDESEFPAIAGISNEMFFNEIKNEMNEPLIKTEHKKFEDELLQDPLDVSSATEDEGINESGGEMKCKTEETKEMEENRKHTCPVCHKDCRYKSILTKHVRIHTGEKPFSCRICNKSFKVISTLNKHVLTHSAIKPYECEVCYKVFSQNSHLKNHKMIHSDLKPFNCTECNKSFRQKRQLFEHMSIHTGDRSFKCGLCERAFTRKTYLIKHNRLHNRTNIGLFSCDICGNSFGGKRDLNRHKKLIHDTL